MAPPSSPSPPTGGCCSPGRGDGDAAPAAARTTAPTEVTGGAAPERDVVTLARTAFRMGSEEAWAYPDDGEGPVREVTLSPFAIDRGPVTNDAFAAFVAATGHRTDAERFGWSFVFGGLLPDDFPNTRGVADAPWWRQVGGAEWRHPEGPGSSLADRGRHPVVHVSWQDAVAYAGWAGVRLPSESEWEGAARGGLDGAPFPWGEELEPDGEHRMNVWQGTFPSDNTRDDGFVGTSPVGSFPPNGHGLWDMTGNVWEWVQDWFTASHDRGPFTDPTGPAAGERRVQRGGSYLCHASYCRRYRVSARLASTPDSSIGNTGFRCAVDLGSDGAAGGTSSH